VSKTGCLKTFLEGGSYSTIDYSQHLSAHPLKVIARFQLVFFASDLIFRLCSDQNQLFFPV
jgi:hypothetical protein